MVWHRNLNRGALFSGAVMEKCFLPLFLLLGCGCERQQVVTETPPEITNSIGMELVRIPAGEFLMGTSEAHPLTKNAQPQHRVQITKPFYMGVYEVTQQQFEQIVDQLNTNLAPEDFNHFCDTGAGRRVVEGLDTSRFPVDHVTLGYARMFCETLSSLPDEVAAGRVYRLPTEAEWEYACRAGTQTAFSFGDSLTVDTANINGAASEETGQKPLLRTTVVGSYPPNDFGLYDMHGNMWEWCSAGQRVYDRRRQVDPHGPLSVYFVMRGGAWDFPAQYCQSAYRTASLQEYVFTGFRVVCEFE